MKPLLNDKRERILNEERKSIASISFRITNSLKNIKTMKFAGDKEPTDTNTLLRGGSTGRYSVLMPNQK